MECPFCFSTKAKQGKCSKCGTSFSRKLVVSSKSGAKRVEAQAGKSLKYRG